MPFYNLGLYIFSPVSIPALVHIPPTVSLEIPRARLAADLIDHIDKVSKIESFRLGPQYPGFIINFLLKSTKFPFINIVPYIKRKSRLNQINNALPIVAEFHYLFTEPF